MTKHEFEVAMTCEGCSGAVTRILNKLGGKTDIPSGFFSSVFTFCSGFTGSTG
ncbi:ATX1 antioxidant protein 1, partial [Xenoophorus captivus]